MTIYAAVVTLTIPGEAPVDIAGDTLVGASIDHGGDGLWDQADPSTASWTMLDPDGTWQRAIGFTTHAVFTVNGVTRFTGTVTDMRVTHDDGDGWLLDLVAVGPKTAARTFIIPARNQETAAARVEAAWTAAGMTIHAVDTTDSVALLPTTSPATVSEVTDTAAHADLGFITQRRDGAMWYRSRATVAASQLVKAVLPADGVLAESEWVRSIGEMSTRVLCGWGTAEPQDPVTAIDTAMETELGRVLENAHADIYATQLEAQTIAETVLARRAAPGWRTAALSIDLALPDYVPGRTDDVLSLEVADVVWVTGAPASTPAGTSETYVVMGWVETLDGTNHRLELRVAEYGLVRDTARWGNVSMSWATAGTTPVGEYRFSPPTLGPGVQP